MVAMFVFIDCKPSRQLETNKELINKYKDTHKTSLNDQSGNNVSVYFEQSFYFSTNIIDRHFN